LAFALVFLAAFFGAFLAEAAERFIGFLAAFLADFFFATAFFSALAAGRLAALAVFFFTAAFFFTGIGVTVTGGEIIGWASTGAVAAGVIEGIPSFGFGIFAVDILGS
jgi:hypothetical protein